MRAILPLLAAVALSGCNEQRFFVTEPEVTEGVAPAQILGRICDPSGRTWLADALIYTHLYDSNGNPYDTRQAYSDRDGYWFMQDLPADREYTFYVQYGDQFLSEERIFLNGGDDIRLDEPDCFDPLTLDVAVITGDYDEFERVLSNMGFANYQIVDGLLEDEITEFLLDYDSMLQYDIIFFNGGHTEEDVIYDSDETPVMVGDVTRDEQIMQNIGDYVRAGGTIYASDWAYDVVEQGWPDRVDWVGDDYVIGDAQTGEYALVNAAVTDSALASWLDTNYVQVEYDLPVWPPIESVSGSVSVHMSGNIEYRLGQQTFYLTAVPILVSFTAGEGKVAFSTFRVARNASTEMVMVLQYMMYNL